MRATLPTSFFPCGADRGCPRAETSGAQLKGELAAPDTVASRLLPYEMTPEREEKETAILLSHCPHPQLPKALTGPRAGGLGACDSPAGGAGPPSQGHCQGPSGAALQDMTERSVRKSEVSHGQPPRTSRAWALQTGAHGLRTAPSGSHSPAAPPEKFRSFHSTLGRGGCTSVSGLLGSLFSYLLAFLSENICHCHCGRWGQSNASQLKAVLFPRGHLATS